MMCLKARKTPSLYYVYKSEKNEFVASPVTRFDTFIGIPILGKYRLTPYPHRYPDIIIKENFSPYVNSLITIDTLRDIS